MIAYRVANSHLGQMSQDFIKIDDFRQYANQANSSIKRVADIARSYDLSDEDRNAVNSELGKVAGFTIAMAERPRAEMVAPVAQGSSWVAAGILGLVTGSLIGYLAL